MSFGSLIMLGLVRISHMRRYNSRRSPIQVLMHQMLLNFTQLCHSHFTTHPLETLSCIFQWFHCATLRQATTSTSRHRQGCCSLVNTFRHIRHRSDTFFRALAINMSRQTFTSSVVILLHRAWLLTTGRLPPDYTPRHNSRQSPISLDQFISLIYNIYLIN